MEDWRSDHDQHQHNAGDCEDDRFGSGTHDELKISGEMLPMQPNSGRSVSSDNAGSLVLETKTIVIRGREYLQFLKLASRSSLAQIGEADD